MTAAGGVGRRQFLGLVARAALVAGLWPRRAAEGWKATLRVEGRPQATIREHGAILTAVERREPEAARRAMRKHLQNALRDLAREGLE